MRVIINGIEKFPRFCGECFLMSGETCECSVPGIERTCNSYDGRYDDCPMSPLQTHGRLGDLDALIDKVIAKYLEHERKGELVFAAAEVKQDIVDLIGDAPTIIQAEPAEEGET